MFANTYVISVTLKASSIADAFKGFLVEARRADPSQDTDEIIGLFTPVQNSKAICGVHPVSNGLTHDSPQQKLSLTFKWTAPTDPDAPIVFRATFVQSFRKYWVDIRSPVVHLQKLLTTPTTSPATTATSSSTTTTTESPTTTTSTTTTTTTESPTTTTEIPTTKTTTTTTTTTSTTEITSPPTTETLTPTTVAPTTTRSTTTTATTTTHQQKFRQQKFQQQQKC
ncbi:poly(A) polymerase-like [Gigantopelta aegis]|uniref:poly(A) polymerase-like n=1 Tax=Gigantopelta aegis TaxID=1735272 RepID=UPI001B888E9A|nr:poly(A) polymerase-like [Gigantopelta aegis]